MARDSLLKKLRRKSRDEDSTEVQAENRPRKVCVLESVLSKERSSGLQKVALPSLLLLENHFGLSFLTEMRFGQFGIKTTESSKEL